MTGQVTLLPATIPAHLQAAGPSRVRDFNDDHPAEGTRYTYSIKASVSLVVSRQNSDGYVIETDFGPSAWEEVAGDTNSPIGSVTRGPRSSPSPGPRYSQRYARPTAAWLRQRQLGSGTDLGLCR